MKKGHNLKKMKEVPNLYKGKIKKNIEINFSPEVIDYFKEMSRKSDIPYEKLIDLYLKDCVEKKRKLPLK